MGNPSDPVSFRDANDHPPYLEAVIKEAMRLHPLVDLPIDRHVPAGGVKLCGQHNPVGTIGESDPQLRARPEGDTSFIVDIYAWVIQRDPNVFPDPEAFLPERWLGISKKLLREMNDAYLVSSAGIRVCLGRNISWLEMTKLIPQLFREYKISLTYPDKEWKTTNRRSVQQEELIYNLERRKSMKA